MFWHVQKCLTIYQPNVTTTKEDYKLLKDTKIFLKKKKKKQQYCPEKYKSLSEDEKKLVEYKKKHKMRKYAVENEYENLISSYPIV